MRSMFRKLMSSKTFKELKLCKVKVCILYLLKSCPTDGSVQLQTVLIPVSTEWYMDRRREEALMLKRTVFTRGRERCETEPGLNPDEPRGKRWKLNAHREICSEHVVCKRLKESKCTCNLFQYIILAQRHICRGLLALRHLWAGSNLKSLMAPFPTFLEDCPCRDP